MIKAILVFVSLLLFSFNITEQKKIRFEFTVEETKLVYDALGKLPAEQVEGLRMKIVTEYNKQIDTTKKK